MELADRFVVVDVETANADLASICQIGVVALADGQVEDTWETLVDPEDYFDGINVGIHGIDESTVKNAPAFPDIAGELMRRLTRSVTVSHMSFDRVALSQAHAKYEIPFLDCRWLDTARVCRRAWSQFARKGYGLNPVAEWCGVRFQHHQAAEDARAAGLILLKAMQETGLSVEDWISRCECPIDPSNKTYQNQFARQGNPDGPLAGEQIVFTGALSIPRSEAAKLAAMAGCDVGDSISKKKTTVLVVGDQDTRKLAGHEKSSKQRKAEELIAAGVAIRILGESDFRLLVEIG